MQAKEKKLTGYPSTDKPWLKYYSEEAIKTQLPECTIYEYLWENNKNYLGNVALNYYGKKITFGELFQNIKKVARALWKLGIRKGDVVVLATVTIPETVYLFYALNLIGAVSNMVDPRTSIEGIKEYVKEVDAKYVFAIDAVYEKIMCAVKENLVDGVVIMSPSDSLPLLKKVLFSFRNNKKHVNPNIKTVEWKTFLENSENAILKEAKYEKDACCVIVHTGGTTGVPKGVMLSNENINALVMQSILTGIDMKREHTWMDIMPPFIAYGVGMGLHLPLVIGMQTILIPSFDSKKFDKLLLRHKPVHMVGVPSYWTTIIESKKMRNKDLSFVIAPTVGGDSMNVEFEKLANEFLKKHNCTYGITKGYGMTEVCAGVTGTVDANNEIGSVGIPFVKSIVSIFDVDSGEELTYGQIGEVCISGPNVMLGYYNNEKATKDIVRRHTDGMKWVHSGDLGMMNENGSLFIVDRMKRMIVRYDGFKVFPSLIENVINSHNTIKMCCVVGKSDEGHGQGELPVAFVVLKEECEEREKVIKNELIEMCKKELPEYAQPVGYAFCKELALTPIGKVDYRKLEELVR